MILRPSLVWNLSERNWSVPLAIATDIGYEFRKNFIDNLPGGSQIGKVFPPNKSINLEILAEYAIRGALGELDATNNETNIWTNDMMI